MILYTYQPSHYVFPVDDKAYAAAKTVQVPGGFVMLEKSGDTYTVRRLVATDPNMYLDQRYSPGAVFEE